MWTGRHEAAAVLYVVSVVASKLVITRAFGSPMQNSQAQLIGIFELQSETELSTSSSGCMSRERVGEGAQHLAVAINTGLGFVKGMADLHGHVGMGGGIRSSGHPRNLIPISIPAQ